VPDEAHEAMRDLVRLRAQAMRDLRKSLCEKFMGPRAGPASAARLRYR
jgi:hypothetical protein